LARLRKKLEIFKFPLMSSSSSHGERKKGGETYSRRARQKMGPSRWEKSGVTGGPERGNKRLFGQGSTPQAPHVGTKNRSRSPYIRRGSWRVEIALSRRGKASQLRGGSFQEKVPYIACGGGRGDFTSAKAENQGENGVKKCWGGRHRSKAQKGKGFHP